MDGSWVRFVGDGVSSKRRRLRFGRNIANKDQSGSEASCAAPRRGVSTTHRTAALVAEMQVKRNGATEA